MHCHLEIDPLGVDGLLTAEERKVRAAAAEVVDRELLPLMPGC